MISTRAFGNDINVSDATHDLEPATGVTMC